MPIIPTSRLSPVADLVAIRMTYVHIRTCTAALSVNPPGLRSDKRSAPSPALASGISSPRRKLAAFHLLDYIGIYVTNVNGGFYCIAPCTSV